MKLLVAQKLSSSRLARIETIEFEYFLLRHLASSEMGKVGILVTANDAATWCWAVLLITIAWRDKVTEKRPINAEANPQPTARPRSI